MATPSPTPSTTEYANVPTICHALTAPAVAAMAVRSRTRAEASLTTLALENSQKPRGKAEEADKVAGFAVGADDYLTKPFSLRELTVRVKAILRRVDRIQGVGQQPTGPVERNGMMIDAARRRVEVDGEEIGLTPLEFEILYTLARDPGVVHEPRRADGSGVGLPRLRRRPGRRFPRRADPSQARRGRQRAAVHPNGPRCRLRVQGVIGVAMRPLEKLPSIRAKLGSVIVLAVAMTLLISYVVIGFALRNSPRDSEAIDALALAR